MLTLKMAHILFVALTSINSETIVCIAFRMNNIASGDYPFLNSIIGNTRAKPAVNKRADIE